MTQTLIDLLSTPWSYAVIVGIAALDALVPVVPSETLAITGGVLAGLGKLHLGTVITAAAVAPSSATPPRTARAQGRPAGAGATLPR
jgi:membrane protein DedA with SNARE-associated domain